MRRSWAYAAVVLLCGCDSPSGAANTAGPLGAPSGDSIEACLPRRPGQSATFGLLEVPNTTDAPLTLADVSFAETDGVTVLGAVVAPPDDRLYATGFGWPETEVPIDVWNELTRPLEDAKIGVDATELVLIGLRLDETNGMAQTVLLDYEADGESHQLEVDHTYRLRPKC